MRNAVLDLSLGNVKRWGNCDFTADGAFDSGTETQVALNNGAVPNDGLELRFQKIVNGAFADARDDAAILPLYKQKKMAEIDARTEELIEQGFEYPASSGQFFSLDLISQLRVLGADHAKDLAQMQYPVRWNTLDNLGFVDLADASDVRAFFLTALGTYRARIDSGTTVKDAVRAATDRAGVDAVVDNR